MLFPGTVAPAFTLRVVKGGARQLLIVVAAASVTYLIGKLFGTVVA